MNALEEISKYIKTITELQIQIDNNEREIRNIMSDRISDNDKAIALLSKAIKVLADTNRQEHDSIVSYAKRVNDKLFEFDKRISKLEGYEDKGYVN